MDKRNTVSSLIPYLMNSRPTLASNVFLTFLGLLFITHGLLPGIASSVVLADYFVNESVQSRTY